MPMFTRREALGAACAVQNLPCTRVRQRDLAGVAARALERAPQETKEGWARRFRAQKLAARAAKKAKS